MSVIIPKRKYSECQYVYDLYQLAIRVGEIVANKPDKYIKVYGNYLIENSLEALKYGQIADRIDLKSNKSIEDSNKKFTCLKEAYWLIDAISTSCQIFLLQVSKSSQVKEEKIIKEMENIGTLCNNAHNSLLKKLTEDFNYIDTKF